MRRGNGATSPYVKGKKKAGGFVCRPEKNVAGPAAGGTRERLARRRKGKVTPTHNRALLWTGKTPLDPPEKSRKNSLGRGDDAWLKKGVGRQHGASITRNTAKEDKGLPKKGLTSEREGACLGNRAPLRNEGPSCNESRVARKTPGGSLITQKRMTRRRQLESCAEKGG